MGLSVGLMLYILSNFPRFTKRFWDIFECCSGWTSQIFQFKEKKAILSNCYQFTKELGN